VHERDALVVGDRVKDDRVRLVDAAVALQRRRVEDDLRPVAVARIGERDEPAAVLHDGDLALLRVDLRVEAKVARGERLEAIGGARRDDLGRPLVVGRLRTSDDAERAEERLVLRLLERLAIGVTDPGEVDEDVARLVAELGRDDACPAEGEVEENRAPPSGRAVTSPGAIGNLALWLGIRDVRRCGGGNDESRLADLHSETV
jgi:hypothetical protein